MGERRILVIGSQCESLGRLSFLPEAAKDLYAVMIDPEIGGWVPALPEDGLLLDPTCTAAHEAIETAYRRASENEATLLFAFIGHGEHAGRDFFLLPYNAGLPAMAHTTLHLVQLIKDLHGVYSGVDGLVVLLDACYAGVAGSDAAARWVGELMGTLRFEVLTAVADRPAADGCFSRTLTDVLRTGIDNPLVGGTIRCEDLRPILIQHCKAQLPQLPAYNADDGLFLARNAASLRHQQPWLGTSSASEIERLTEWFQPTPQLQEVVAATQTSRCVAVFGPAGAGKSALAAALARPDVTEGAVPVGFVQAVVFLSEAITTELLASELARQFERSLPDFTTAAASFEHSLTKEEQDRLDLLERRVIGPLRWLKAGPIRLVVDGLDRLPTAANETAYRALTTLATGPELARLHLLVTARPDTPVPPGAQRLDLGHADDEAIRGYLNHRVIALALHGTIVERAAGNWLIARLLADLAAAEPETDPTAFPRDLTALYEGALQRAGATEPQHWRTMLRPVLGVLAAAGIGPVLPLPLLCAASGKLGGPDRPPRVRDVLVDLRGFIARGALGTPAEQVGLFHQTLADYLLDPSQGFGSDPQEAHEALIAVLDALAPMDRHDQDDPLHRYAAASEAEHLWAIGQYKRALDSLEKRASPIPAENLRRWHSVYLRGQAELGPDHPDTLTTRNNIAHWTGQCGDAQEALRLFHELLPDQMRVLGPDHPDALTTRNNIAHWTGQCGDAQEALRLFHELLPDQMRVLGPDHPDALRTRANIAHWTGQCGDAQEALRLFQALLPDQMRVLGPDHPDTLRTRANIAAWTGESEDAPEALRLFQALLPDQMRVLGPDHPDTLRTRANIATWTGESGDAPEALRLFQALLPDQMRVLGPDHPDALTTRNNIAAWTGESGDAQEALRLFQALLPDPMRVLGPDHPDTLRTRNNIAGCTGQCGDAQEALRLFQALLPDQMRVLGRDHPDTRNVQAWIDSLTRRR